MLAPEPSFLPRGRKLETDDFPCESPSLMSATNKQDYQPDKEAKLSKELMKMQSEPSRRY